MVFMISLVICIMSSGSDSAGAVPLDSTNPSDITVATRIMAAIGRLDEFQVGKEDFDCYMDRMEQYFIANSIAGGKQVAVFLTAIGGPTYELVRNLLSPAAPKDKTLA